MVDLKTQPVKEATVSGINKLSNLHSFLDGFQAMKSKLELVPLIILSLLILKSFNLIQMQILVSNKN